jgi:hypothetical protein
VRTKVILIEDDSAAIRVLKPLFRLKGFPKRIRVNDGVREARLSQPFSDIRSQDDTTSA